MRWNQPPWDISIAARCSCWSASARPEQPAPKLYVPVTEAHLVGKYVGVGKVKKQADDLMQAIASGIAKEGGTILERKEF